MNMFFSVIALLFAAAKASAGDASPVFRSLGSEPPVPSGMLDATVLRVRPVLMNTTLFGATAAGKLAARRKRDASAYSRLVMDFFPDAVLRIRWTSAEKNDQGGIVWTGSVEGARWGEAVMVSSGNGVVGNVTRGDGRMYQIRTVEGGAVWLREIDQKRFREEGRPK